jgi:hypothetical protein
MKSIAKQSEQTDFTEQNVEAVRTVKNQDPRRHPRKPFRKAVLFHYDSQKHKGIIRNISRSGALIETRARFLFGQSIELVIPNNGFGSVKRLQGWMVRSSRHGIGITFKRIFERRSGKERRHAIDRRIGRERRQKPKQNEKLSGKNP